MDSNNINQYDKSKDTGTDAGGSNDLGKADKMGAFAKPYSRNINSSTQGGKLKFHSIFTQFNLTLI